MNFGKASDWHADLPIVVDDAERVLAAESLESLAAALGYRYEANHRYTPEEDEPILGETAAEYRRVALTQPQRYDDFIRAFIAWYRPPASIAEPAVILDIGSGVGLMTLEIARQFPNTRIFGVDLSEDMVSIAEEFLVNSEACVRSRVRFLHASVYALRSLLRNLSLSSVDVVLSRHMFHRLKRPGLGLQQMIDCLCLGGSLYMTAFCGDLDTDRARGELLRTVKQRFQGLSGEYFWNFSRCYLSAVLRAPGRADYERCIQDVLSERTCSYSAYAYRLCEMEICLTR